MAKANDDSFTIVYQEREGKPTFVVTGAYGGSTPDGTMVVAHVYVDYGTIPSLSSHPKQGMSVNLSDSTAQMVKRSDVTRDVQATLAMSPETAANLGKFLIDKAALAIAARDKKDPKQQEGS